MVRAIAVLILATFPKRVAMALLLFFLCSLLSILACAAEPLQGQLAEPQQKP